MEVERAVDNKMKVVPYYLLAYSTSSYFKVKKIHFKWVFLQASSICRYLNLEHKYTHILSYTLKIQIGRNDPLTMVVLPRNSNNRFLGNSNCG